MAEGRILLDEAAPVPPGARPIFRGRAFVHRSPLARKIITFNLIALGLLVAGVLYLTQFEDGLISERGRALGVEARLVARALAAEETEDDKVALLIELSRELGVRARLFDTAGLPMGEISDLEFAAEPPRSGIVGSLRDALSAMGRSVRDEPLETLADSAPGFDAALAGEIEPILSADNLGQLTVSVAAPVVHGDTVQSVVVLATRSGEIDQLVRRERAQILQMFGVAAISSVLLSLVLANAIANPLRDLAAAAETGGAMNKRRLNPERIKIPDMSARPDEIGYLSAAMRSMTAALYDRIEANESFAADVAHEIKNPLTSLRSAVESMRHAATDEERAQLTKVILQDVNRLDRLVTDIRNASQIDMDLVRADMEAFSLSRQIEALVQLFTPEAEAAEVTLRSDIPEETLVIEGLEGRLAQVFINLMSNALSFTPQGGTVTIRARVHGTVVRVTVEDTGPGIPPANLEDIFNRFYSERPETQFGNHSGLGLAISRQIVEAHGGRVWAENRKDGGARLSVEVPR